MSQSVNYNKTVGVIILAAGFSSRMKKPKPFLQYDDNRAFIDKIIGDYVQFGCNRIIISINEAHSGWAEIKEKFQDKDSVIFVANLHPELERFYSIKSALDFIDNQDYCFLHNADNPFIGNKILNQIYDKRSDEGYTVPIYKGQGGHPILLGRKVIQHIKSAQNYTENFKEVLKGFERINVEVDTDKIHININTQEEYDKYFSGKK